MRNFAAVVLSLSFMPAADVEAQAPSSHPGPVLIQGALKLETARLIAALKDGKAETIGPFEFWRGTIEGYPVIVSRTRMGASHAAAATALAIERFHPVAIVNQGTAGGHDPAFFVGDIVLGTSTVSLSSFKSPPLPKGSGSNTLAWIPTDLVERANDEDGELHESETSRFRADPALLAAARATARLHATAFAPGRIVEGAIGSSDVWHQEVDRIARLRATHGTAAEEMESAPTAQIAQLFGVPYLAIRVISASAVNGGAYDPKTGDACQDFVLLVLRAYIAGLKL